MKYFLVLCLSVSFAAFAEIIQNNETGVVPTEKTEEFNSDAKTHQERLDQQRMEEQRMEDRRIDDLREDGIDNLYENDTEAVRDNPETIVP